MKIQIKITNQKIYLGAPVTLAARGLHTTSAPVKSYSNADVDKVQIVIDNRDKAGVYRWVNTINNNSYIGSSISLSDRLLDYYQMGQLLRAKRPIDFALLKYGYSNFRLEILEYCEKKETLSREQYYFDLLKPEYNILKVAGSTLGFKHSVETLNHMKNHHLLDDEVRKNMLNRMVAREWWREALVFRNLSGNFFIGDWFGLDR